MALAQADVSTQVQSSHQTIRLTPETKLHYDHYDPLILNEHALRLIRQGDADTAKILLQRAVRLMPDNQTILYNLQLLEGKVSDVSETPPQSALATPPQTPPAQSRLPPEPPALWPEK